MSAIIRLAREDDAAQMLAIYAPIVRETAISFELVPPTEDEFRQRIRSVLEIAPWLVCERDGDIMGYAYASRYRPRAAYQWSVEVTVYVNARYQGKGVGRAVYTSLFECLRLQGFRSAFAVIALPNRMSIALHESLGFDPVGVHRAAGYKLGQWHDIGWWQLTLQEREESPAPPRPLRDFLDTPQWQEAVSKGLKLLRV
ncbi:MAG: N-acetyltransferase family protein [Chloroflexi bacterium]|nr:N-acetyltransferase family protein [Chloroflexota bacterium]